MIVNEFQYYYSVNQFIVSGCKREQYIPAESSTFNFSDIASSSFQDVYIDDTNYTMEICIQTNVSQCIANWYSTINSQPSYSFTVPLLNKHSTSSLFNISIGVWSSFGLFISFFLFLLIVFLFYFMDQKNYICRSRTHLLLSINVLVLDYKTNKKRYQYQIVMVMFIFFALCYALVKYSTIYVTNVIVSEINCSDYTISLQFYSNSNMAIMIITNLFIFIFLFKDPMTQYWNNTTQFYNDLNLISLFYVDSYQDTLEFLKSIVQTHKESIEDAMKLYVEEKYPNIPLVEKNRRILIFSNWSSSENDILEAITNYKLKNEKEFKSISFNSSNNNNHNNTIDLEINDGNDSETEILIKY